ncbi:putative MATE family efflux protein [Caldalkalibacillus uzonensis]|uniref:MATE family efflux protein n=1 Tax=Caldalkalibacillus uzonensis TaxID=353224 RepID=A0ABU0CQF3_9BACI|nr:MATE family efflux transporter [Caldalkalibacillus uzonensis]MDQ0338636.1 putative MATE family efflux protein [Caldalkalibacillus uzonensis]
MKQPKEEGRGLSLVALTWPIFIEILLFMMVQFADIFMLSFISDEAVAAVGVANDLMVITFILFNFVAVGTGVVVAQYLGAKKKAEASKIEANALVVNVVFGLMVSLVLVIFRQELLGLFSLDPDVKGYASGYMLIVGCTLFTQALLFTLAAIIRSNGFTRDAMYVSLGMNVVNVIGNYLFIFGALGVPQLGVTGVAISTAASRILGMITLFILLYRRLEVRIEWQDYLTLNKGYLKKILQVGAPAAGEHMVYQVQQLVFTFFISMLGTAALATKVYTFNLMMFILLFSLSVGQGMQILIGHLVGAGRMEEAYRRAFKSLKVSMLITVSMAVVFAVFRESLIRIYTDDPHIISLGATLLLICLILEPGRTFNLVLISSLRATGDARFPFKMAVVSMWGISVPLAYVLGIHFGLGLIGVWVAYTVDEWFRGLIMLGRWRSRKWESKVLVEQHGEQTVI